jgi:hypothetical protein
MTMLNPVPARVVSDDLQVGGMTVGDKAKGARGRSVLEQQVEDPPEGASVRASRLVRGGGMGLSGGAARAAMGSGIEGVDVPGRLADGGGETEGEVLGEGEGFEMVDDEGAIGE